MAPGASGTMDQLGGPTPRMSKTRRMREWYEALPPGWSTAYRRERSLAPRSLAVEA